MFAESHQCLGSLYRLPIETNLPLVVTVHTRRYDTDDRLSHLDDQITVYYVLGRRFVQNVFNFLYERGVTS